MDNLQPILIEFSKSLFATLLGRLPEWLARMINRPRSGIERRVRMLEKAGAIPPGNLRLGGCYKSHEFDSMKSSMARGAKTSRLFIARGEKFCERADNIDLLKNALDGDGEVSLIYPNYNNPAIVAHYQALFGEPAANTKTESSLSQSTVINRLELAGKGGQISVMRTNYPLEFTAHQYDNWIFLIQYEDFKKGKDNLRWMVYDTRTAKGKEMLSILDNAVQNSNPSF